MSPDVYPPSVPMDLAAGDPVTGAGRDVLQDKRNARTEAMTRALEAGFTPAEVRQLMVVAPLLERLAQSL